MNWLRQRRDELGLTQEELTAKMQVEGVEMGRSTLSHWETERYKPPLSDEKSRAAIARALKLSVKEVLKRSGYDVAEVHSNAAERAAHIVDQLDSETQDKVVKMLEALL